MTQYFQFYNEQRWHKRWTTKHEWCVSNGCWRRAKIVDKFNGTGETSEPVQKNWDSAIQLEVSRALS